MAIKVSLMPNKTNLSDNGYSIDEQEEIYDEQLEDIFWNVRWYLDNLENMKTYRVAWHDYRRDQAPVPYRYTEKGEE